MGDNPVDLLEWILRRDFRVSPLDIDYGSLEEWRSFVNQPVPDLDRPKPAGDDVTPPSP